MGNTKFVNHKTLYLTYDDIKMFNAAYKRERSEPYVNAVTALTYDKNEMFNAAFKCEPSEPYVNAVIYLTYDDIKRNSMVY